MGAEDSTEVELANDLPLFAQRPALSLEWADETGSHSAELNGTRALLGTADGAQVRVVDRFASRLHAELRLQHDGVWVRDLGSTNGVLVNGLRVVEARLPPDFCQLRIGRSTIDVRVRADHPVRLWPDTSLGPLVGPSDVTRALLLEIAEVARTDATVLVRGETGTGKELVARQIHECSRRADQPFVVVDCAALPEGLVEAELFGVVKGAYTGADATRVGAIESAHGGTVFLDEIGELPLALQPKLLRVMESKTIRRLGESEHREVDVRFVTATHRDLERMSAERRFREDLYFRIAVLVLSVAPVRERPGDILPLLEHFLGRKPVFTDPTERERVLTHPWTGNVRELKNFATRVEAIGVARAVERLDGAGATRAPPRATPEVDLSLPFKPQRDALVTRLERTYLQGLIATHGRNTAVLSEVAGLDRSYVHRLLKKHGL